MADETAHIIVSGVVQGVGYRYFVARQADALHLRGFVRNLPDGTVEVAASGPRGLIGDLVAALKVGPRASRVSGLSLEWVPSEEFFKGFEIR
jgi:acylphosphatase